MDTSDSCGSSVRTFIRGAILSAMFMMFEIRSAEAGGFIARADRHPIEVMGQNQKEVMARIAAAIKQYYEGRAEPPPAFSFRVVGKETFMAFMEVRDPPGLIEVKMTMVEPTSTPDELLDTLSELTSLEKQFRCPQAGTKVSDLEKMMTERYLEVNNIGRCYKRSAILGLLGDRLAIGLKGDWRATDFKCQHGLQNHKYRLSYTHIDQAQITRSCFSNWEKTPEGWRISLHKTTVVKHA